MSDLDIPDSIGPYAIERALGRGGMGVVYAATHVELGTRVALKTMREPEARMVRQMRREIRVLRRLRHPGVVRVLDEGEHEGAPWYAMERLTGQTLADFLRAVRRGEDAGVPAIPVETSERLPTQQAVTREGASGGPELGLADTAVNAPPRARPAPANSDGARWGAQRGAEPISGAAWSALPWIRLVCLTLAYMHGEGVVHCDLKPENIIITPDAGPVLVDFGIATHFGSRVEYDALATAGLHAGTAAYVAPEQIKGLWVDARADLYAVGCILYELITGRPPFVAAQVGDVLNMHLNASPRAPGELGVALPEPIAATLWRLLQKDPKRRPGHINTICEALSTLGIDGAWPEDAPQPRPYLYKPSFKGRDDELAELAETLRALDSGQGTHLIISGDSGAGKTRLALELVQMARTRDAEVLVGRCAPLSFDVAAGPTALAASPLQGLSDVLRAATDAAVHNPRVAEVLAADALSPFLRSREGLDEDTRPRDPTDERAILFALLADLLDALCGERHLVLVVDDMQWADELTLEAFDYLARLAHEDRPWLIASIHRATPSNHALAHLSRDPHARHVRLGRLDADTVGDLIGEMLGRESAPHGFSAFIAERAEGNPYYVTEYVREAVERGLLELDDSGRWLLALKEEEVIERVGMPGSVHALVMSQLRSLDAHALLVCEHAAVLGRQTSRSILVEFVDLPDELVSEQIEVLTNRELLEEPNPGLLRFAHHTIHEAAYDALDEDERASLHAVAARLHETRRFRGEPIPPATLAFHCDRAGMLEQAALYWRAAGDEATHRYAHIAAEQAYLRALELESDPHARDDIEVALCERVYMLRTRHADARPRLERVSADLDARPRARARAHAILADIHRLAGSADDSLGHLHHALDLYERLDDLTGQALSQHKLARLLAEQGQPETAWRASELALDLAERAARPGLQADVLHDMARQRVVAGSHEQAEFFFARALELRRGIGDRKGEADTLNNLATLRMDRGQITEALSLYEQVLALRRAIGDRRGEGATLNNLALAHKNQSRYDEALALYERALEIRREVGDRRGEGNTLGNVASILALLERYDQARALHERALSIRRSIGDVRGQAVTLYNLALVLEDLGDLERSDALLDESLSFSRQIGYVRLQAYCLRQRAITARLTHQLDDAHAWLDEAFTCFDDLRDSSLKILCHCERGFCLLAASPPRDEAARRELAQATRVAFDVDLPPDSDASHSMRALDDALLAHARGETLSFGQRPEDLPARLTRNA
jgi:serine/threonine protein kinase/tetratricopeptide (TPR) repeat protein